MRVGQLTIQRHLPVWHMANNNATGHATRLESQTARHVHGTCAKLISTSARMAVSAVWIAVAQDLPASIEQSRRVVADDRGGIFKENCQ